MIKQFILLVLLSLAAIFFRIELSYVLDGLVYIHNYIARTLHLIFSDDPAGRLIQNMVSLLIIPVVAGFVVATAFWLIKRMVMPHMMAVIWVLWLILLTTMVGANAYLASAVKASPRVSTMAVGR
ncbi:hypothetical protein [Coxiella endosymbiont of Ornithodoros maritimus]|uniref:hypothetical protein n=1 Tax=Coxiella endosymbiont of Ornithodoros maritimus TaxID=1656172 RepID=UPI0022640E95|nr:hypothetical protein [Coxiella endosymbiont of Ornithodoros maritimus]